MFCISVNNGNVEKTDDPLSSPSSAYLLVPPPQSRQKGPQLVASPRGSSEATIAGAQSSAYEQHEMSGAQSSATLHPPAYEQHELSGAQSSAYEQHELSDAVAMTMPSSGAVAPHGALSVTSGTDVASQIPDMGGKGKGGGVHSG